MENLMKTILVQLMLLFIYGGHMDTKNIHWLGHSSFRIDDGNVHIYIDPFRLTSNEPKADIIFITHGHFDHYSADDIARIRKEGTVFVAPKDVAAKIGKNAIEVVPGQNYTVGQLKVSTVPAYNIGKKFHPRENNWVGYIITLTNGLKIYHAGDTDFIPEMKTVSADIAMLPCDGTYTMNLNQMSEAANYMKPKLLLPMHSKNDKLSDSEVGELKKLYKGEMEIKRIEK